MAKQVQVHKRGAKLPKKPKRPKKPSKKRK